MAPSYIFHPHHQILLIPNLGLLKKAASGVLAIFSYSRTVCTLCAKKWLRPCWTNFLNRPETLSHINRVIQNNLQSLFLVDLPLHSVLRRLLFGTRVGRSLYSAALFELSELVRSSSSRPSHPIWPNRASMALSPFAETKGDRLPGRNPAITMD